MSTQYQMASQFPPLPSSPTPPTPAVGPAPTPISPTRSRRGSSSTTTKARRTPCCCRYCRRRPRAAAGSKAISGRRAAIWLDDATATSDALVAQTAATTFTTDAKDGQVGPLRDQSRDLPPTWPTASTTSPCRPARPPRPTSHRRLDPVEPAFRPPARRRRSPDHFRHRGALSGAPRATPSPGRRPPCLAHQQTRINGGHAEVSGSPATKRTTSCARCVLSTIFSASPPWPSPPPARRSSGTRGSQRSSPPPVRRRSPASPTLRAARSPRRSPYLGKGDAFLYWGDNLGIDITKHAVFETRVNLSVLPNAATVQAVWGLASVWIDGPNNNTCFVRFVG